jgi:hypothetical protein
VSFMLFLSGMAVPCTWADGYDASRGVRVRGTLGPFLLVRVLALEVWTGLWASLNCQRAFALASGPQHAVQKSVGVRPLREEE